MALLINNQHRAGPYRKTKTKEVCHSTEQMYEKNFVPSRETEHHIQLVMSCLLTKFTGNLIDINEIPRVISTIGAKSFLC